MIINQELKKIPIYAINLKERKEKRKFIKHQFEKKGIPFQFFLADKHPSSPKRGCLESHLTVIKNVLAENKHDMVMIFEDDAKFINAISTLKKVPEDWDMLYFGGTVFRILEKKQPGWTQVQTWTTHAYMINLKNKDLVNDILQMENYDSEIDRFYIEKIHSKYNCYMADPMICIQKEGYSDIEGKMVDYSFMTQTLKGLRVPESGTDENGNYVLKLPDIAGHNLPKVSIITPTYNRRTLFAMAMYNVFGFVYPKEKIEWVVVEDVTTGMSEHQTVGPLLPKDPRIKYIKLEPGDEPYTIAMKRNIGVANSSSQIIVHVDDDDIYDEYSLLSRVKLLLKYQAMGIECLGSTMIGTYDIVRNRSSMATDGPISLSEASMAYTKRFWEERKFDDACERGEHKAFTEGRLHKIMDVPYCATVIALIHKMNFTHQVRDQIAENQTNQKNESGVLRYSEKAGDKAGQVANFLDTFSEERQIFILDLRDELMKEYKMKEEIERIKKQMLEEKKSSEDEVPDLVNLTC